MDLKTASFWPSLARVPCVCVIVCVAADPRTDSGSWNSEQTGSRDAKSVLARELGQGLQRQQHVKQLKEPSGPSPEGLGNNYNYQVKCLCSNVQTFSSVVKILQSCCSGESRCCRPSPTQTRSQSGINKVRLTQWTSPALSIHLQIQSVQGILGSVCGPFTLWCSHFSSSPPVSDFLCWRIIGCIAGSRKTPKFLTHFVIHVVADSELCQPKTDNKSSTTT